jgi:4'-phosphopantetheinyl transferase
VRYRIFDDMTQCSEQEVARLLPLVSPQRREQALRYTHMFGQFCCLKSYEMLTELLASTPYTLHPTPSFLYNEYRAPYLENGPYFSISHCKQGIAVAVSETPIGIDIEAIRPFNEGLMRKTMNSEEQTYILSSLNPEIEFIRLWTRKEAYVKMQGTGIIADMHDILCNATNVHWEEILDVEKRFICTICQKKTADSIAE